MSIVFDARKHAEQSKRGREATAGAPQLPESGLRSSEQGDIAPANEGFGPEPKPERQLLGTVRIARSDGSWAPGIDITNTVAERAPVVRSLLRTPRSEPLAAASRTSDLPGNLARAVKIEPAAPIVRTNPVYPAIAEQRRISGSVEVRFRISPEGKVYDVKSVRGAPILARAAIEAVRAWCYKPARLNGAPIDSQADINFDFNLD